MGSPKVWYASYGSNLCAARLACYLAGGRPEGGRRTYPGARDATPPAASVALTLPGSIYFAGRSTTWGGGMAFYDHDRPGPTPARAYLVTAEQFADVAVQEMDRDPHADSVVERALLDPLALNHDDASHLCGGGLYSKLLRVGALDGAPVLTFTAPHGIDDVPHVPPTAPYRAMITAGLIESHGWSSDRISEYLDERSAADSRCPDRIVR
ncbi:hypothetical protein [Gordonia phthalatica]|uniref:Class II RPD3 type histone deacetylase n=1 Tax=Gordonia phthalatica TaxID=1136941 RepID=A0A0N9NAB9_9ACTN|nr:hypothetical protein [Gordonia phthalatica]ALG84433.1 class II RPD3 type histone deacetylase [Gordonia phthalatica]